MGWLQLLTVKKNKKLKKKLQEAQVCKDGKKWVLSKLKSMAAASNLKQGWICSVCGFLLFKNTQQKYTLKENKWFSHSLQTISTEIFIQY